jgi:hypothetical protein
VVGVPTFRRTVLCVVLTVKIEEAASPAVSLHVCQSVGESRNFSETSVCMYDTTHDVTSKVARRFKRTCYCGRTARVRAGLLQQEKQTYRVLPPGFEALTSAS